MPNEGGVVVFAAEVPRRILRVLMSRVDCAAAGRRVPRTAAKMRFVVELVNFISLPIARAAGDFQKLHRLVKNGGVFGNDLGSHVSSAKDCLSLSFGQSKKRVVVF